MPALQVVELLFAQQRDRAARRPVDQPHQGLRAAQVAGDQPPRARLQDRPLRPTRHHERPRRTVEQPAQHVGGGHRAPEPLSRGLHLLKPARLA